MRSVFRRLVSQAAVIALLAPTLAPAATLPPEIDAPGLKVVARLQGMGEQIYECAAGADGKLAWTLREPIATLMQDTVTVGRHYVGPTWMFDDGSFVKAKVDGKIPGVRPNDVPWLRLKVTEHSAQGSLAGVTVVQRLNTEGGGGVSGSCLTKGMVQPVPYTADYVFLAP